MKRVVAGVLLSIMVLSVSVASAQIAAVGTVRGYVKDQQGGVLPGVTITATSPTVPTPHSTVSNDKGFFRLVDLPPADYAVTAELQGFSKYVRQAVGVRAGLNISFDIPMALGGVEASTAPVVTCTSLIASVLKVSKRSARF